MIHSTEVDGLKVSQGQLGEAVLGRVGSIDLDAHELSKQSNCVIAILVRYVVMGGTDEGEQAFFHDRIAVLIDAHGQYLTTCTGFLSERM